MNEYIQYTEQDETNAALYDGYPTRADLDRENHGGMTQAEKELSRIINDANVGVPTAKATLQGGTLFRLKSPGFDGKTFRALEENANGIIAFDTAEDKFSPDNRTAYFLGSSDFYGAKLTIVKGGAK